MGQVLWNWGVFSYIVTFFLHPQGDLFSWPLCRLHHQKTSQDCEKLPWTHQTGVEVSSCRVVFTKICHSNYYCHCCHYYYHHHLIFWFLSKLDFFRLSLFEFLSFVKMQVFEFHQNKSFLVLSQFEFLVLSKFDLFCFVTIWVWILT